MGKINESALYAKRDRHVIVTATRKRLVLVVAIVGFATRKPFLVTVACPDRERLSRHPWLEVTANIELTFAAHTSDGLVLISVLRFDGVLDILVSDSTPTKKRVEELPH